MELMVFSPVAGPSLPLLEIPVTLFETVSQFFLLSLILIIMLWPINWSIGQRQRKEGEGTYAQLFKVSLQVSCFQVIPMLVSWLIAIRTPSVPDLKFLVIAELMVVFGTSVYLLPPIRLNGSSEALSKYEEPKFLSRLEVMCSQLGIQVPVVRFLNSSGGAMGIQAFAGGLPAPSLVVSDGVIHRLTEDEANAIVGHELGHIANWSLWWFPFAICVAWTIGVVSHIWLGAWLALLFGFAVQVGLRRIVSRYFEFDSDRKAASVAGYATTVSALDKIHISSPVSNKGWLSFLAYSVATHPSHEERLQGLYDHSPPEDRPDVSWSSGLAKRRQLGARFAFFAWLTVLLGSFQISDSDLGNFLRSLLYLSMCLIPSLLINNAIRQDVKSELKRRQFRPKSKSKLKKISLTVIVMISVFYAIDRVDQRVAENSMGEVIWIIFGVPIVLGILMIVWGIWRGSKSPQAKLRLAIHQRRWQDAVDLGREFQEKIKNDAPLRHDLNLAVWMTGEQEEAITAMQTLRHEFPTFSHPWLIEALMHLERGAISRALKLIDEVREDLQGDVSIHGIAARCYRQLGDLAKMKSEAATIEEIIPDAAAVHAFRCAIALDEQEFSTAREHHEKADRLAPGDAYITLLKAELEHFEGDEDASQKTLSQARRLIDATPFSFLGTELRHVAELHKAGSTEISEPRAIDPTDL